MPLTREQRMERIARVKQIEQRRSMQEMLRNLEKAWYLKDSYAYEKAGTPLDYSDVEKAIDKACKEIDKTKKLPWYKRIFLNICNCIAPD